MASLLAIHSPWNTAYEKLPRLENQSTCRLNAELRALDNAAAAKPLTIKIEPRMPEFTDVLQTISPMPLDSLGVACEVPTTVAAVEPNSPAAKAGIQPGDEIVSEKLISPPQEKSANGKGEEAADDDESPPPPKTVEFGKMLSWPGYVLEVLPTLDPATKVELEVKHGDKTNTVELAMTEMKTDSGKVLHSPHRGFSFAPMTIASGRLNRWPRPSMPAGQKLSIRC